MKVELKSEISVTFYEGVGKVAEKKQKSYFERGFPPFLLKPGGWAGAGG
jgi:hypothetical protein